MATNIADFLKGISTTVGFANDEFSHAVLSNPELLKIEIPDELVNGFNTKYLTEASAKASPVLQAHYFKSALDPIDRSIKTIMDEMEFSKEDRDEVNAQKSSYSKNDLIMKKLKTMSSASTSEEDKLKFTKEIQRLNGEVVKANESKETAVQEETKKWMGLYSNSTLQSKIKSQELYTTDTLNKDDVTLLANTKLERALQEKNAEKVFDYQTGNFKLVQKTNPDLAYFEGGKEVTFDAFLTKTLADAKLLKTTSASTDTTGTTKTKYAATTRTDEGQPTQQNSRIKSSADADVENLLNAV